MSENKQIVIEITEQGDFCFTENGVPTYGCHVTGKVVLNALKEYFTKHYITGASITEKK